MNSRGVKRRWVIAPALLASMAFGFLVFGAVSRASSSAGEGSDFDGDGCADIEELGTNQALGGQRDSTNQFDYMNPTHDGMNRVDDILAVVQQYFRDDNDSSPGSPPYVQGYDPGVDRSLLGPNPWNLGPPNGQIRADDILHSIHSYFHDCAGKATFPQSLRFISGASSLDELDQIITVDLAPVLQSQKDIASGKQGSIAGGQTLPGGYYVACILPDGTVIVIGPGGPGPTPGPEIGLPDELEDQYASGCP